MRKNFILFLFCLVPLQAGVIQEIRTGCSPLALTSESNSTCGFGFANGTSSATVTDNSISLHVSTAALGQSPVATAGIRVEGEYVVLDGPETGEIQWWLSVDTNSQSDVFATTSLSLGTPGGTIHAAGNENCRVSFGFAQCGSKVTPASGTIAYQRGVPVVVNLSLNASSQSRNFDLSKTNGFLALHLDAPGSLSMVANPEPGTLGLMLGGGIVLGVAAYRRRTRPHPSS